MDERLLALAYSAADVTVVPSLADNLPGTGLESLACGTPSVAFSAGGVGEVVHDHETGLVVPPSDAQALAKALTDLLTNNDRRRTMGVQSRRTAEHDYSAGLQARRYAELDRGLLDDARSPKASAEAPAKASPGNLGA